MTVWLRGDHLIRRSGPVARRPDEPVLLIESESFARKLPYHPHKLILLFSAMRHFRDNLRDDGRTVRYQQTETRGRTAAHVEANPDDTLGLTDRRLSPHGAPRIAGRRGRRSRRVCRRRPLPRAPSQFDEWRGDGRYRHEDFYRSRAGRRAPDGGDDPVGGEWNYDDQNRETPPEGWTPPEPPRFDPDE